MAIGFVTSTSGVGTTGAANTTGATFLVLLSSDDAACTVSDSKGNTWTPLTAWTGGSTGANTEARLWYCASPTVGSGHTASVSPSYGSIAMLAFTGVETVSPLDAQVGVSGAGALVTAWGVPSLTPAANNELLVFGASLGDSATSPTIDSGFTVSEAVNAVASVNYGLVAGYKVQTTAAAVTPAASWTNASRFALTLAAFKAAATSAATAVTMTGPSSGYTGVPSSVFTVGANGTITGTITVTPSDGGAGGSFTPASVNISSGSPTATFTYTASSNGAKTISVTNSGGLTNPTAITYTAATQPAVSAATVAANGQDIALTLSVSASLTLSDISVRVNGVLTYPTAVTGSGTSWTATMGLRWIHAGAAVTAQFLASTPATATNNSVIFQRSTRAVGLQFEMFLHYGPGTTSGVEWTDPSTFNVNDFNPTNSITACIDQWIACAQLAGMRGLVLTAKHHDGFCLWPSAATTFDIAATTWYASNGSPDIVRIFCQRVRAAGLNVGLYFSPWDRRFEFDNPGFTSAAYQAHTQAQITELLTNYGQINEFWMDGWDWASSSDGVTLSTLPYASVFTFARNLQPGMAIVVNNHRGIFAGATSGSDLLEYEGGTLGNQIPSGNKYPAQECDTIRGDNQWFHKAAADTPLSAADIASARSRINSRNGTYLLNCPPDPSGFIPPAIVSMLAQVGAVQAEYVGGISTWLGNGAQRTVTVTLTTNGTTPAASLSGLRWAFYDTPNPGMHDRPVGQGIGSTNSSGVFTAAVFSALASGGIGWLEITDSDGTVPAGTGATGFNGPVAVS
jgi:alpha-L-fucosidase